MAEHPQTPGFPSNRPQLCPQGREKVTIDTGRFKKRELDMTLDTATRKRKIIEGLEILRDAEENPRDATRAFKAADWATGLALAAFHERRYERAVHKALEALRRTSRGDDPFEERGTALLILRRACDRLSSSARPPSEAERVRRAAAAATQVLNGITPEEWSRIEGKIRGRLEGFPDLFGPLLNQESGVSAFRDRLMTAYQLFMETWDEHGAADLVREGDLIEEKRRVLLGAALCNHCLTEFMTPNKTDPSGDPWYYPRRLLKESLAEVDAGPPPEGAHRESAFLEAVASLNLSKYAEDHGKDEEAARFRRSAEVRLTEMPSLPLLAPGGADAVPDFVEEGARLYFEALLRVASDDMPGGIERLEAAAATVTSFWSDLARERLPGVRSEVDKGVRDKKAMGALDRFIEALEGGNRDSELEALDALEPFRSDMPWLDRERNFLLVATRKTLEPPAILRALRDFPGDPELSSLAREVAGQCAERGDPAEAMALLETQGPLEDWSSEDLGLYATLAEKAGKPSALGRALAILARYDCGKAPRAAEVLLSLGQRNKAIRILREELDTDCRNLEHRWQAWEVSRGTGDPRLERQAGGLLLGTLRADDPRRPLVEQRVAALMAEERRSHAEKVSEDALLAAARGDWSDVERMLDGFEGRSLRPEVLEVWARSKAETGKWGEAAELYGLLGDEPDWAWRTAECHLRAGDVPAAHGVIRRLQERVRDEGGRLLPPKAASPDLEALIALSAGDLIGAAKSTTSPAVLREILQESVRLQDRAAELLVLGKLEGWGKLEKGEPERLRRLWDESPLSVRSRLGFLKGRMIVLCDTNVLVSLTLQRLKTSQWLGLRSREDIVARVDALRKKKDLVVVSPAVRAEFLRLVHSPPEKGPTEAFQQLLKESREVLSGATLKEAVGQDIRASQRHLDEVQLFFSRQEMVKRSRVLTRLKIRDRPEMAETIASHREGKVDGAEASSVAMPELGDRWLMAEAIRVSELALPGFYGVGILSDDRDFREFRSDIQREFGVSVLGAM